ncbi:hypothetical protein [Desulfocurvus vexinensis]|uniref:hypothetical protein n=1 Tax=Desulfocurvus vexinensis TaxID=399548 RepID=UPI0012EB6C31|nr:hypothetical protein [Desulfocurvus vexinensis]
MSRIQKLYDVARGRVFFFDFGFVDRCCCTSEVNHVDSPHYALCIGYKHKRMTSFWLPLFSRDTGGKHGEICSQYKIGDRRWVDNSTYYYCNQIYVLKFSTLQRVTGCDNSSVGNFVDGEGMQNIKNCCAHHIDCLPTRVHPVLKRWDALATARSLSSY